MVIGSREALSIDEYLMLKTGVNTVEKVYKDLFHFLPEAMKQNLIFWVMVIHQEVKS